MNRTNVLVVGSGGREHALAWKLQQSKLVGKVFCAPGNGGIGNSVPLDIKDFRSLAEFASRNSCFTVIGPEEPLANGITDFLVSRDLQSYGVNKEAALAESSKIWAKFFMKKRNICTPDFQAFEDASDAIDYVKKKGAPVVVKADGLAAGKGVTICYGEETAVRTIDEMMVQNKFGDSGQRVVVEELLVGEEASYMAIVDSVTRKCIPLASSQDHKPIFDGDKGPNTGGMGAYSPAPIIKDDLEEKIRKDIIEKFIDGMRAANIEYRGTLYLGLMISDGLLYVLEFNVRFGDPEIQPVIVRMKSDLLKYLQACVNGRLDELDEIEWLSQAAVCVVMASSGYPGQYQKGKVITGLDRASGAKNVVVFHAGTKREGSNTVTNGGRVLGVTALGDTIPDAIEEAYRTVSMVSWEGEYHRTDIGRKALKRLHAA